MKTKNLTVIATIFVAFFGQSTWAAGALSNVRWGIDVEENVGLLNSTSGCESSVKKSLKKHGFIHKKTGRIDQGITIFSSSKNGKHKAIVKCMNEYDLLITIVIGRSGNLSKAESINNSVKNIIFAEHSKTFNKLNANTQEKEWIVQVGAFELATGAEKLFEKLKVNGIAAEITKNSKWWKVILSPSPVTLEKAKNLKWQLKDRLDMDSIVKTVE